MSNIALRYDKIKQVLKTSTIFTPNEIRTIYGLEPINSPDGDGEFVVSNDLRSIHIPDSIVNTGIRGDEWMSFKFKMPRYAYGYDLSSSECNILINYLDTSENVCSCTVYNKDVSEDRITFAWHAGLRGVCKDFIRFCLVIIVDNCNRYITNLVDIPVSIYDAPQHSETKQITNCVNCGAPVDPRHDRCEYCGTSYRLMGMTLRNEIDALTLENKAINASIDMTRQYQEILDSLSRHAKIIRRY